MAPTNKVGSSRSGKRSRLRFGIITLFLLTTAIAIGMEKPVRKILGKRAIEKIRWKRIAPSEVEFSEQGPNLFSRFFASWAQDVDQQSIKTIRLNWTYRQDPAEKLSKGQLEYVERANNQKTLLETLLRHPAASEDVTTLSISHPLTPQVEAFILSRKNLRVLEISETVSANFLSTLRRLKQLDVLYVDVTGRTNAEIKPLMQLKWVQWIRIRGCDIEQVRWLREQLPNTYVD